MIRELDRGPLPIDNPRVHARGIDSDSILLFGAGAAVGWGVLSHGLALPGALARALSARTGRGTDVEVIAGGGFTAASALDDLAAADLGHFDAVVVTLGLNESVQLSPLTAWRRDMEQLLDHLTAGLTPGATIYLIGVHSPTVLTAFDAAVAPLVAHHRDALNAVTAELCANRDNAIFIGFEPIRGIRGDRRSRSRSVEDYRAGATAIAWVIAPQLDRLFGEVIRTRRTRDEEVRQAALDALEIVGTVPEARFDRIVSLARRAFGTASAALTIIDNDRQWLKSSDGVDHVDVPRDLSICATTIEQSGELVVGDITTDWRFATIPQRADGHRVRFYAGFPIEAPGGERIGALCVFDPDVRDPSDVDRALLRDLALMVQDEIWQTAHS